MLKTSDLEILARISERHGMQTFGKLNQKLVALALHELGFLQVMEYEVQGTDVRCSGLESRLEWKFALEVKTTKGDRFDIDEGNLLELQNSAQDGYRTAFCVLQIHNNYGWLIVKKSVAQIQTRAYRISECLDRDLREIELEKILNSKYSELLENHETEILKDGINHMRRLLESSGIKSVQDPQFKIHRR